MSEHTDCCEDKFLVDQCLNGDRAAWKRFCSDYTPDLVRFAHWLQGGRAILGMTPEGTVQEVYCRLCSDDYDLLRQYNYQQASLRSFLMGLVHRQVQRLRARAKRRVPAISLEGQDRADPGADGGVAEAAFDECVAHLSPAERELLAEEMRQRQAGEQQPPQSERARKAKQRLVAKVRNALSPQQSAE